MNETELTEDEADDLLDGGERDARMGRGRRVRVGPGDGARGPASVTAEAATG
jgi:hypothetical protein